MPKVLSASCVGKVVTVESVPITDATILSEGNGSSSGIAVIEQDKTTYISSNATDLKALIQSLIDCITQINLAFTALGGVGPTNPVLTSFTTALDLVKTTLTTNKELLK
jgi:hypothetical protein